MASSHASFNDMLKVADAGQLSVYKSPTMANESSSLRPKKVIKRSEIRAMNKLGAVLAQDNLH